MQVTSIFTLLVAATGALAMPRDKPNKPTKPSPPNNSNVQTISCSSGDPFCCTSEYDSKLGLNYFECSDFVNSCNSIAVCCNNNANNGRASQTCSAFGNTKVIFI